MSRATALTKKQRRAICLQKLGEGMGVSQLTSHVAETMGVSRRQARRIVRDAQEQFAGDYAETEDGHKLFEVVHALERVVHEGLKKGDFSNVVGACKQLNSMLRLGADQKSIRPPHSHRPWRTWS